MALSITANAKLFGGMAKGLVNGKTYTIDCEGDIKITLPRSFLPTVEPGESLLISLTVLRIVDKPAVVEPIDPKFIQ